MPQHLWWKQLQDDISFPLEEGYKLILAFSKDGKPLKMMVQSIFFFLTGQIVKIQSKMLELFEWNNVQII